MAAVDVQLNVTGDSLLTAVAILREPAVPAILPGHPPAGQFPGLQVGRLPAQKISSPTINLSPARKKPEGPVR